MFEYLFAAHPKYKHLFFTIIEIRIDALINNLDFPSSFCHFLGQSMKALFRIYYIIPLTLATMCVACSSGNSGRYDAAVDALADTSVGTGVDASVARVAFSEPALYPAGYGDSATAGDLNGDGISDLVISAQSTWAYLGSRDNTLQPGPMTMNLAPELPQVGDFNGDGKLDAMTVNGVQVGVLLGRGDGGFEAPHYQKALGYFFALTDLNGDGALDAVFANRSVQPALMVLLGDGQGAFDAGTMFPFSECQMERLVAGDFNGDGKSDVIVSCYGQQIFLFPGEGNGTFAPAVAQMVGPPATVSGSFSLSTGDWNGDGRLDVALGREDAVYLLLQQADGSLKTTVVPQTLGRCLTGGADLDGDGNLDLLILQTGSPDAELDLLLGDGKGGFAAPLALPLPVDGLQRALATGDFNGDGYTDIVVSGDRAAVGHLLIFWNQSGQR